MSITIIAAIAANSVIGSSKMKKLPWIVPEEMKHFREQTLGKTIVMGRTTAEETGALLGRKSRIVIANDWAYTLDGFISMSLDGFLRLNESTPNLEYFVCGGAKIYEAVLPYADRAIISNMSFDAYGDIKMPILPTTNWKRITRVEKERFTIDTFTNVNRVVYDKISHQLLNKKEEKRLNEKA